MRGACMSFSSMKAEIDRSPLFSHVTARLWQRCLSFRNQFCDAVVNNRLLTWDQMVSAIMRRHDPFPHAPHVSSHCFFGLHQLTPTLKIHREDLLRKSVVIVEAEKTAFVLSERYPEYLWLAAGGLGEVQADKFRPLRGRRIIMMPDTDPDGTAFKRWNDAAQAVMLSVFWEDSPPHAHRYTRREVELIVEYLCEP